MKKSILIIVILFICFLQNFEAQKSNTKFQKKAILEDLEYLYNSLEKAHYNLYAYTTKDTFKENYIAVKKAISKDSITLLEAITIFQKVISAAKNSHTEIDFPGALYIKYAENSGTVFPLELSFENDKALIRKNYSKNQTIKVGSELLSINGVSIKDVLSKIYPQISAERIYFKNAKIEMYSFPRLYWQVFGKQDDFQIEILSKEKIKKYTIQSVNLITDYETKRDEILNAKMNFKFYNSAAYLNPGNFGGDETKYQKFIDSAFININRKQRKNLIIDLRNNAGGDNSFSDYLVSYIADKPFRWNSKLYIKTSKILKKHTRKNNDTTEVYFKNILSHKNGQVYNFDFEKQEPQPKNKRFYGDVYVLVNRQSYSQATVTAAQIQDYNFGIIVGEETGEYPTLFASIFAYTLPNTGIVVKVAKGQIVRVNGTKKQKGVTPNIHIKDHLLDENDEILDGILKKLN